MIKKILVIYSCFFVFSMVLYSCRERVCKGRFTQSQIDISTHLPVSFVDTNINTGKIDSTTFAFNMQGETFDCVLNNMKKTLLNTAYATSISVKVIVEDELDSFDCITIRDYNSSHLKGFSVNDIMQYSFSYPNDWSNGVLPYNEIVASYNKSFKDLYKGTYASHYARLTQNPTNSGDTVQLESTFIFKSGLILRDTSELFVIKF